MGNSERLPKWVVVFLYRGRNTERGRRSKLAVNQYKKDGNGPNAHKKGNRTDSKRETAHLSGAMQQLSEDIASYKEIAEKIRQSRKYKQEDVAVVYDRLNAYIENQREECRPLTVSGMIKASGLSKSTWYEMLKGDYDYQLYQLIDTYNIDTTNVGEIDTIPATIIEINGYETSILLIAWSEMLQKAMLSIEEQTEERLYEKGRVGDIFALKSVHNWKEDATPQTVNQTLVIATEEQARKAIELLK